MARRTCSKRRAAVSMGDGWTQDAGMLRPWRSLASMGCALLASRLVYKLL